MPVKYEPYKKEYEELNKLFVEIVESKAQPTSMHADELLNDLHDLVESIATVAFATGLELLGKVLGDENE